MASDSFIFAAYLAAKMPHMHFGFSVVSVPLHHPVRLVERINILDQLTEGKLLVGVGSGTTPEEMIGFGVNYAEAGAIAERNLATAEALWAKQMDDPAVEIDNGPFKGRVLQRIAPTNLWQAPRPADAGGDAGEQRAPRCGQRLAGLHPRLHPAADLRP